MPLVEPYQVDLKAPRGMRMSCFISPEDKSGHPFFYVEMILLKHPVIKSLKSGATIRIRIGTQTLEESDAICYTIAAKERLVGFEPTAWKLRASHSGLTEL